MAYFYDQKNLSKKVSYEISCFGILVYWLFVCANVFCWQWWKVISTTYWKSQTIKNTRSGFKNKSK